MNWLPTSWSSIYYLNISSENQSAPLSIRNTKNVKSICQALESNLKYMLLISYSFCKAFCLEDRRESLLWRYEHPVKLVLVTQLMTETDWWEINVTSHYFNYSSEKHSNHFSKFLPTIFFPARQQQNILVILWKYFPTIRWKHNQ